MICVNALFPIMVGKVSAKHNVRFIQPSTDCVFSGVRGPYSSCAFEDCTELYGMSKLLGEAAENATVIRSSIIGEDDAGRSLLGWLISQKGGVVDGFMNHYWNGMTCLEYARLVDEIVSLDLYWIGVRAYRSTLNGHYAPSKYDLVCAINSIYTLDLTIIGCHQDPMVNRVLLTEHMRPTDLLDQLKQMRETTRYSEN